jgi:hypothetical protein
MTTMGWNIFYSYAHEDDEFRKRLVTFLGPLRKLGRIADWDDHMIAPGVAWDQKIKDELSKANLILFLIGPEFLDSDYVFGVEVEAAFERVKRGEAKVVPILMRPCLWDVSPFSALQIIPRDAKPVSSWGSADEALREIASEISKIVAEEPPCRAAGESSDSQKFDSSLELVRNQVRSYARIYERTRQRMAPSDARTARMEQIMTNMRNLATASYPLLNELVASPSPGERLAAVAILQIFAAEDLLPFLVDQVKKEKPFVCFHALTALRFAANSLDPSSYGALTKAIDEAKKALEQSHVAPSTDRGRQLSAAERELQANMAAIASPTRSYE